MKNILFLTDYYLPNASPNGICCSKIIEQMRKNYNIAILCYNDKQNDEICFENKMKIYKISQIPIKSNKLLYYSKWLIPFTKVPPYTNVKMVNKIYNKVLEIIENENINTIIFTYLPIENIIVGNKIKNKFNNIKCIGYMLDSFSGGLLPKKLPKAFGKYRKKVWESKILKNYDKIFLMESSKEHHQKYTRRKAWYKNAEYVDIPMIVKRKTKNKKTNNQVIHLLYTGGIYIKDRDPKTIIRVLEILKNENIFCEFIGNIDCPEKFKHIKTIYKDRLKISPRIPYKELEKKMIEADILINIGGKNTNLVPSKIFEYMNYGKPIISTFETTNDSSIKYLKDYPATLLIDAKDKNLDYNSIVNFIKNSKNIEIKTEEIEKIYKKNTPDYFIEKLKEANKEH